MQNLHWDRYMITQTEQEFRDCLISLGLMSLARQLRSEAAKLPSDAEKIDDSLQKDLVTSTTGDLQC